MNTIWIRVPYRIDVHCTVYCGDPGHETSGHPDAERRYTPTISGPDGRTVDMYGQYVFTTEAAAIKAARKQIREIAAWHKAHAEVTP